RRPGREHVRPAREVLLDDVVLGRALELGDVRLFVAGWLVWELSPLQSWIGTGRGYWSELSHWFSQATDWAKDLSGN
ncbi:serine/threonine protein kinase, partial [Streptomyces sp. NPDC007070]